MLLSSCEWFPFATRCHHGEQIALDMRKLVGPLILVHWLVLLFFDEYLFQPMSLFKDISQMLLLMRLTSHISFSTNWRKLLQLQSASITMKSRLLRLTDLTIITLDDLQECSVWTNKAVKRGSVPASDEMYPFHVNVIKGFLGFVSVHTSNNMAHHQLC